MLIKAIIVDDEHKARELLCLLINRELRTKVEVHATCASVEDALKAIMEHAPDLVFLDIEMVGESGFSLLEKLEGRIDFQVIFTTAYSQYALDAFKVNALDYILKPVTPAALIKAVTKAGERLNGKKENGKDTLIEQFKKLYSYQRLGLPTDKGVIFIDINNILRCEASSNYTYIYLNNKQRIIVCRTLKQLEEALRSYSFFRIHKSHLVNLKTISGYRKGEHSNITLSDGTELPVSRNIKAEFEETLEVI